MIKESTYWKMFSESMVGVRSIQETFKEWVCETQGEL